ncbi:MAG: hypothetical protein J7K34_09520 [Flavobacteriaceae bacterium]|nr:hypothetical protein [Flavobacteriaceae bacterium]
MKNTIKIFSIVAVLFLIVGSCQPFETDLEVENLENPNDNILTSDPVALEATAGTIIQNWFMSIHSYNGPGAAFATMADVSTCSWGNFGMRDTSSEPRVAWNNTSSYGYGYVTNTYFNALYAVLSDANTLALSIKNETQFDNPAQIEMMAKFGQALSTGYLALVFDKVWLSDEDGVVDENGSTYQEAMTFALKKLDEAIAIAKAHDVSIPDSWLPGGAGNSTSLLQFMNSMGARMLVNNVRNSSQKASIEWSRVLDYSENGLTTDFEIYMDDVAWYDLIPKTYLIYPGWARVDMRIVAMMANDGTPDYWEEEVSFQPESTSDDARLLTDYGYLGSNSFRPERGKYHFSSYRYSRYDEYITLWTMNVVEYAKAENDMYMAEAMALTGDVAGAASVINAGTRTTRGNLPDVAADLDAVKNAIFYERMVEFSFTSMGLGFFEMRKENLLQSGTLLHFPTPGKALEAIPAPSYTFGGAQGVAGEDYSNGGWR